MGRAGTVLLLGVAACGNASRPAPASMPRDTVAALVVNSGDARCTPENTWTLEPRSVFDPTGDSSDFGRITSMALAPDGELYVLDGMAKQVDVFGADGTERRTFGRPGNGPGEFRMPSYVGVLGPDRVAVGDGAPSRLHVFTPNGEFVRDIRLEAPEGTEAEGLANVVAEWAVTPAGGIWAALRMYYPAETDSVPVRLVRFDRSGEVADTVLRWKYPGYDHSYEVYKSWWRWSIGSDGTVVSSPGNAHEVFFRSPDGHEIVARRDISPIEITPGLREAVRERYFDSMKRNGESAKMIRQARERFELRSWPAVMDIQVASPSGRAWALETDPRVADDEPWIRRYDVYAPTGRYLGCTPIPIGFRAMVVTDSVVWGSWLDELDVPHVRSYAIVPPFPDSEPE